MNGMKPGKLAKSLFSVLSSINFRQGKHHHWALSLDGVIIRSRVELDCEKLKFGTAFEATAMKRMYCPGNRSGHMRSIPYLLLWHGFICK